MKNWILSKRHDLAVALIPKCGLNTIREWIGPGAVSVKSDDEALFDVTRRVAFIRNPIDRLISAYSFFYWMDDYGMRSRKSNVPINDWDSFVDYVLSDKTDDVHWTPQLNLIGYVANIYHRFENILEHYEKYRPGMLPHNNITSHRPVTNHRMDEIMKKYQCDLNLWERIN